MCEDSRPPAAPIRIRVCGADEKVDISFYDRRAGIEGTLPRNFSAFRETERRFKAVRATWSDTDIVDTRHPLKHAHVRLLHDINDPVCFKGEPVSRYEIENVPGLSFIPAALAPLDQKRWILRALRTYMNPPNPTNLNAHYVVPDEGLWRWVTSRETHTIRRIPHPSDSKRTQEQPIEMNMDSDEATTLFRRIRWAALGQHYDWRTLAYDHGRAAPFPPELAAWSNRVLGACGYESFNAEAAIVNFYQPGDTLTGHVDRSEDNLAQPLLSLSLGASAVFLVGGATRDDPVTPMLLHSGDIVILAGPARRFYHGVPRVCEPTTLAADDGDEPDIHAALSLLGSARININIRQVH